VARQQKSSVMPPVLEVVGREQERAEEQLSSPGRDAWRRFRHNRAAMAGLGTILALLILSIFAPFMNTVDPLAQDYANLDLGPSPDHWFGTDGLGRDQYSRIAFGLRVPLLVGVLGAAVTTVLGAILGVVAGYFGGLVDSLLARFTDIIFAFPGFTLALIVVSLYGPAVDPYFGGASRVVMLTIVFALVGWPALMRFVRSLTLRMKEEQFVEAARVSGSPPWKIMVSHLLPNMYGMILVQASFLVVAFVSTEAVLSILGLGVAPPNPDLGAMLFEGTQNLGINYWETLFPATFLAIIILAFTFFGDGVRDAVDPRGQE